MDPLFRKYFPELSPAQENQFSRMAALYRNWNDRVNLVSRKDIDHLSLRHILHSLSVAKIISFKKDTRILDAGTGGGFPGIPLAVFFPEARFMLADSIGKKIKAVTDIACQLGLRNLDTANARIETIPEQFDFVLGRAVTDIRSFFTMTIGKIREAGFNDLPNGILYLSGGELSGQVSEIPAAAHVFNLSAYFSESFFQTKKLVFLHPL